MEEEEDSTNLEMNSMDLMTPLGERIIRKTSVKPSTKIKEMYWQSTSYGRETEDVEIAVDAVRIVLMRTNK